MDNCQEFTYEQISENLLSEEKDEAVKKREEKCTEQRNTVLPTYISSSPVRYY